MDTRLTQSIGLASSIMPVLFLAFDVIFKQLQLEPISDPWMQLATSVDPGLLVDLLDLAAVILYFIPRTSALGALVLTAHLGGTLAEHAGAASLTATQILFPVYVAALLWGGLLLRKARSTRREPGMISIGTSMSA
jgi:hypothetical protein